MEVPHNSHTLVYVSTATEQFTEIELEEILLVSRQNNARLDISGMLVYGGGNFIQALEGTKEDVHALYTKIKRNPAHFGFITLLDTSISSRIFGDWSMAYRSLNTSELKELEGYVNIKNGFLANGEGSNRIVKILKEFIINNS